MNAAVILSTMPQVSWVTFVRSLVDARLLSADEARLSASELHEVLRGRADQVEGVLTGFWGPDNPRVAASILFLKGAFTAEGWQTLQRRFAATARDALPPAMAAAADVPVALAVPASTADGMQEEALATRRALVLERGYVRPPERPPEPGGEVLYDATAKKVSAAEVAEGIERVRAIVEELKGRLKEDNRLRPEDLDFVVGHISPDQPANPYRHDAVIRAIERVSAAVKVVTTEHIRQLREAEDNLELYLEQTGAKRSFQFLSELFPMVHAVTRLPLARPHAFVVHDTFVTMGKWLTGLMNEAAGESIDGVGVFEGPPKAVVIIGRGDWGTYLEDGTATLKNLLAFKAVLFEPADDRFGGFYRGYLSGLGYEPVSGRPCLYRKGDDHFVIFNSDKALIALPWPDESGPSGPMPVFISREGEVIAWNGDQRIEGRLLAEDFSELGQQAESTDGEEAARLRAQALYRRFEFYRLVTKIAQLGYEAAPGASHEKPFFIETQHLSRTVLVIQREEGLFVVNLQDPELKMDKAFPGGVDETRDPIFRLPFRVTDRFDGAISHNRDPGWFDVASVFLASEGFTPAEGADHDRPFFGEGRLFAFERGGDLVLADPRDGLKEVRLFPDWCWMATSPGEIEIRAALNAIAQIWADPAFDRQGRSRSLEFLSWILNRRQRLTEREIETVYMKLNGLYRSWGAAQHQFTDAIRSGVRALQRFYPQPFNAGEWVTEGGGLFELEDLSAGHPSNHLPVVVARKDAASPGPAAAPRPPEPLTPEQLKRMRRDAFLRSIKDGYMKAMGFTPMTKWVDGYPKDDLSLYEGPAGKFGGRVKVLVVEGEAESLGAVLTSGLKLPIPATAVFILGDGRVQAFYTMGEKSVVADHPDWRVHWHDQVGRSDTDAISHLARTTGYRPEAEKNSSVFVDRTGKRLLLVEEGSVLKAVYLQEERQEPPPPDGAPGGSGDGGNRAIQGVGAVVPIGTEGAGKRGGQLRNFTGSDYGMVTTPSGTQIGFHALTRPIVESDEAWARMALTDLAVVDFGRPIVCGVVEAVLRKNSGTGIRTKLNGYAAPDKPVEVLLAVLDDLMASFGAMPDDDPRMCVEEAIIHLIAVISRHIGGRGFRSLTAWEGWVEITDAISWFIQLRVVPVREAPLVEIINDATIDGGALVEWREGHSTLFCVARKWNLMIKSASMDELVFISSDGAREWRVARHEGFISMGEVLTQSSRIGPPAREIILNRIFPWANIFPNLKTLIVDLMMMRSHEISFGPCGDEFYVVMDRDIGVTLILRIGEGEFFHVVERIVEVEDWRRLSVDPSVLESWSPERLSFEEVVTRYGLLPPAHEGTTPRATTRSTGPHPAFERRAMEPGVDRGVAAHIAQLRPGGTDPKDTTSMGVEVLGDRWKVTGDREMVIGNREGRGGHTGERAAGTMVMGAVSTVVVGNTVRVVRSHPAEVKEELVPTVPVGTASRTLCVNQFWSRSDPVRIPTQSVGTSKEDEDRVKAHFAQTRKGRRRSRALRLLRAGRIGGHAMRRSVVKTV